MNQGFPNPFPSLGSDSLLKAAQRTQEAHLLTRQLLYHQECLRVWIKSETQSYTVQGPRAAVLPRDLGPGLQHVQ